MEGGRLCAPFCFFEEGGAYFTASAGRNEMIFFEQNFVQKLSLEVKVPDQFLVGKSKTLDNSIIFG